MPMKRLHIFKVTIKTMHGNQGKARTMIKIRISQTEGLGKKRKDKKKGEIPDAEHSRSM